jgi:cysteine desulfurase
MNADDLIYLDSNATSRPLPEVVEGVANTLSEVWANPSSPHGFGQDARRALTRARDAICELVEGLLPEGVIFTSGGSESNNLLLQSGLDGVPWRTVITTTVEHPSILRPVEHLRHGGARVYLLDVDANGLLSTEALVHALETAPRGPLLVSIQWANGETGVIQPIAELFPLVRTIRPEAFCHSDASQSLGRLPIRLEGLSADALTVSGEKIHGPQGVGALLLADPEESRLQPLSRGGGQERGLRSGTQNLPGIVGFGVAAAARARTLLAAVAHMREVRDAFEEALGRALPGVLLNGQRAPRLVNTSNVRFPASEGMSLLARLDARGLACALGSACSSARPEPSQVLRAMGLTEAEAFRSLRFSFSVLNTVPEAVLAAGIVARTAQEDA